MSYTRLGIRITNRNRPLFCMQVLFLWKRRRKSLYAGVGSPCLPAELQCMYPEWRKEFELPLMKEPGRAPHVQSACLPHFDLFREMTVPYNHRLRLEQHARPRRLARSTLRCRRQGNGCVALNNATFRPAGTQRYPSRIAHAKPLPRSISRSWFRAARRPARLARARIDSPKPKKYRRKQDLPSVRRLGACSNSSLLILRICAIFPQLWPQTKSMRGRRSNTQRGEVPSDLLFRAMPKKNSTPHPTVRPHLYDALSYP